MSDNNATDNPQNSVLQKLYPDVASFTLHGISALPSVCVISLADGSLVTEGDCKLIEIKPFLGSSEKNPESIFDTLDKGKESSTITKYSVDKENDSKVESETLIGLNEEREIHNANEDFDFSVRLNTASSKNGVNICDKSSFESFHILVVGDINISNDPISRESLSTEINKLEFALPLGPYLDMIEVEELILNIISTKTLEMSYTLLFHISHLQEYKNFITLLSTIVPVTTCEIQISRVSSTIKDICFSISDTITRVGSSIGEKIEQNSQKVPVDGEPLKTVSVPKPIVSAIAHSKNTSGIAVAKISGAVGSLVNYCTKVSHSSAVKKARAHATSAAEKLHTEHSSSPEQSTAEYDSIKNQDENIHTVSYGKVRAAALGVSHIWLAVHHALDNIHQKSYENISKKTYHKWGEEVSSSASGVMQIGLNMRMVKKLKSKNMKHGLSRNVQTSLATGLAEKVIIHHEQNDKSINNTTVDDNHDDSKETEVSSEKI